MHWQTVVDLIRRAWPALGPLIGICIGAYLTTRTQKRQWVRDNKRVEYRELLTAIGDATSKLLVLAGREPVVLGPGEQSERFEVVRLTLGIIYNRLFIAKEIKELNIQHRWQEGVDALKIRHDVAFFATSMDGIMDDIRKRALEEFS